MLLTLLRYNPQKDSTQGLLFIDGRFAAYVIEDEERDIKVQNETCIPEGIYNLSLVDSPKFTPKYGHKMIQLDNVPGFSNIYIHVGNTDDDTSGCLLVGNAANSFDSVDSVLNSRSAYSRLYPIISGRILADDEVKIEIKKLSL